MTCHMLFLFIYLFFFGQSGEAYWWRVCYQRGLPRLVYENKALGGVLGACMVFVAMQLNYLL